MVEDAAAAWSRQGAPCTAKTRATRTRSAARSARSARSRAVRSRRPAPGERLGDAGQGRLRLPLGPEARGARPRSTLKRWLRRRVRGAGRLLPVPERQGSRGAALSLVDGARDGKGARREAPADDRVVVVEGDVYEKGRRDALVAAARHPCALPGRRRARRAERALDKTQPSLAGARAAVAASCLRKRATLSRYFCRSGAPRRSRSSTAAAALRHYRRQAGHEPGVVGRGLVGRGFGALSEAERGSVVRASTRPSPIRRLWSESYLRRSRGRSTSPPARAASSSRAAERLHERRGARRWAARYDGERSTRRPTSGLGPRPGASGSGGGPCWLSGWALRIWEINAR